MANSACSKVGRRAREQNKSPDLYGSGSTVAVDLWIWCLLFLSTISAKAPPPTSRMPLSCMSIKKKPACPSNDAVARKLCVRLPVTMQPLPRPAKVSKPRRGLLNQGRRPVQSLFYSLTCTNALSSKAFPAGLTMSAKMSAGGN
jgi:hypothetical protein